MLNPQNNPGGGQNGSSGGNETLLKQLLEKVGIQWGRFVDIYPRKIMAFYLSIPECDVLGYFQQSSNVIADTMFGSKGFNIKVNKGLPGSCDKINTLIQNELFGKGNFKSNLRRNMISNLILGNMSSTVGMGPSGPEVRFVDALTGFPIEFNSAGEVTKLASIFFKSIDETHSYAIVTLDGEYTRMIQLFICEGTTVSGQVKWGTPGWYDAFNGVPIPEVSELPTTELGPCCFQWWRLPTEDIRHYATPFTQPIINNYPAYREALQSYLNYKKEYGWKLPVMFYNKAFETPDFAKTGVMNSFDSLSRSNLPTVFANPLSKNTGEVKFDTGMPVGIYPNSNAFPDFLSIFNQMNTDFSPIKGVESKNTDCMYKTMMDKNTLFEIWDPPIRDAAFMNAMNYENGRFGKLHRLGDLFVVNAMDKQNAAQTLIGNTQLLNMISIIEEYAEKPLKGIINAMCKYWVMQGKLEVIEAPTSYDEIEIIWDNSKILDDSVDKQRMLSATGSSLSIQYIHKHVFNMSSDESAQVLMELMDPINGLLMGQQKDAESHVQQAMYGVLGTTMVQPAGQSQGSNTAKQANNGKNTEKGKVEGK